MLCLKACASSICRWGSLLRQLAFPGVFPGGKIHLMRCALGIPVLALLFAVQLLNAAGLLLDEILFRRYREVRLRRPVFILGVPRSGTTHTHHLLSSDPRYTTVQLWEALFAPSISQRHLLGWVARLDARCGGYLARFLVKLEQRLQSSLDSVHPTGLRSPEEDFLLLMSTLDCFLLVLAFPECHWLWQLAQADDKDDRQQARQVVKRYRRLLQRHVYFHGQHCQMLSKNASFAGLALSLAEAFPDSVFIVCERDAPMAVRSQLRSLADARRQLFTDSVCPDFERRLLDTLHFYYRNLDRLKQALPAERCASIALARLSREPRQAMQHIHEQLLLGSPDALDQALSALEAREPLRPGTIEPARQESPDAQARFDRFQAWRHAPENRL